MGRINSFKEHRDDYMVIDIAGYLELTKAHLKELNVNQALGNFSEQIDGKIKEGNAVIEKELQPRIDSLHNQIGFALRKATRDIQDLVRQAEADREKVEESKNTFMACMGFKVAADVLKVGAGVAALMGPQGVAASAAIGAFAGLINYGADKLSDEKFISAKHKNAQDLIKPMQNYLNKLQFRKLEKFDKIVKEIKNHLATMSDKIYKTKVSILTDLTGQYNISRHEKVINNTQLNGILQSIVYESRSISKRGRSIGTILTDVKDDPKVKKLEGITKQINAVKAGVEGGFDIADLVAKFGLADDAIASLDGLAKKYDDMISSVSNFLTPMVSSVFYGLEKWTAGSTEKISLISLDFEEFKMQNDIRDLATEFEEFLKAIKIESNLPALVQDTARSMSLVFDVHKRIASYVEKKTEIEFHHALQSSGVSCISDDEDLLKACRNNENYIDQNICLWMYRKAVNAFKQHVFPFAYKYSEFSSSLTDIIKDSKPDSNQMSTKINDLGNKLKLEATSITTIDGIIMIGDFCGANDPIFQWNSNDYKEEINSILSGKRVRLLSPVFSGLVGKDVVRIRKIDLVFQAETPTEQTNLDTALAYFHVNMLPTGDSQFRVQGKLFSLAHQEVRIKYQYKYENRSSNSNGSYKKLESNDWALSPYASWEIWLSSELPFDGLKKFMDYGISLRICGNAMYFETKELNSLIGKDIHQVISMYGVDEDLTSWSSRK